LIGRQLPAVPFSCPKGIAENSSFNEVHRTGAVWRDVDRLKTAASTRTQQAHGAWGTVAIGRAKGLADGSLASNAESTPPHAAGDDQLRDGIHTGHKEGAPPLQGGFSPLVCVASVTGSHTRDRERKANGDVDWITVCSKANFAARERFKGSQGGIIARPPCFPNPLGCLANIDVTTPIPTVTVAPVNAVAADKPI